MGKDEFRETQRWLKLIQRVPLIRALVGKPEMFLLDEPTASIDGRRAGFKISQL